MIKQKIKTLSTPPSTDDPDNFDPRGDQFLGELPNFQQELNTFGGEVNDTVDEINNMLPTAYTATSASSVTVGTGYKQFTVTEDNKGFGAGISVKIVHTTSPNTEYMIGHVCAFANNVLTVYVSSMVGSGSHAGWTITATLDGDAATFEGMTYDEAMAGVNLVNYATIGGSL